MSDTNMRSSVSPVAAVCMILITGGIVAMAYARFRSPPAATGGPKSVKAISVRGTSDDHTHDGHNHSGHSHSIDHGHDGENSIELTDQARANLGLLVQRVVPGSFTQYIEVPGVITNWPGRTHVVVTSPLTGVINAIHVARGELIESGTPLFALRLTHQDLVNTQEQFLTQLGQLDVEEKEIERLKGIAGVAIAGKALLERQYERDKLLAGIRAARQSMLLHGLSDQQITQIEQTRRLVREVTVYAPELHEDGSLHHESLHSDPSLPPSFGPTSQVTVPISRLASNLVLPGQTQMPSTQLASHQQPGLQHPQHIHAEMLVTELNISLGQSIQAGSKLAQLSDYSQVLIEGHAFQSDGVALRNAAQSNVPLQAVLETSTDRSETIDGLKIVYIGNEVSRQSRALPFYVELENEIERSEVRGRQRYVSWRYKPGQRLTLRLPVKQIQNVFVVPNDALAEEGAEWYVFVNHGEHFDRVPVNVVSRNTVNSAIARDGQLIPGQAIAITAAQQLQMAIKNKDSGPHVGHHGHVH